ncbi:putative mitochondrial carrier protein [Leishmania mexicana MHOM/GT/2001/U1103]|uniref:Mitochondrial carrier protein n=1 Tax=Leishmania mexicana (strain MHOM/GT/2001/U1103) TaxID=929439 RepID=E9AX97_LEIMU|nr:putative mitochondrial carrier protein [Leishmania mexicana MHOM/GT/2001/U1103]CBZ27588.1 putative mitochondrial carrier protein [Leishmania mexicana MHOM/GT/2001/U1103]
MNADDAREMLAGSLGGASATVVEYPMDTIKVRLQDDGKRYGGVLQCIRTIAKEEGLVNGFFRGLPAPVIGAACENAILFVSYRSAIEGFQKVTYGYCGPSNQEPYLAVSVAGATGGIVVSQVLTPAELIKCKMQIQNTLPVDERIYKNSLDCAAATYRRRGIRGLFRGHIAMMVREAVGCGLYFLVFQSVIRPFLSEGQRFHEAPAWVHFLGGGCAGVAFWTPTYPVDAVKTKQQTMKADYLKLNFRQACTRLYKTEGMRGLFRGYSVTAVRAFPGNAILIAVYERVNALWEYSAKATHKKLV